jgi:hypothetical protein
VRLPSAGAGTWLDGTAADTGAAGLRGTYQIQDAMVMTYYDDIVRLLNNIGNAMYYYDNCNTGEPHHKAITDISEKIEQLQTKVNQQVTEFHDWIMQRKNLI